MLLRAAYAFLNHLLDQEPWARSRLRDFAGQLACFHVGPLSFSVSVDPSGTLIPVDATQKPDVTIHLPDDTPIRFLVNRHSLMQEARISGSADFAEALGFLARNLEWDVESDLARLIGDTAAHRLAGIGSQFVTRKQLAGERLAANLFEFAADELHLVERPGPVHRFCSEVDRLRDDLARLEKQVSKLSPS
ncbi:MAG: SCP2 sterol-binding domain-containing protein [Zoogloeaceae bacterium]|nr:SCP2 sterol-binding domain-containing protein [Zoogloeaceae bacterium]